MLKLLFIMIVVKGNGLVLSNYVGMELNTRVVVAKRLELSGCFTTI
jgi:hypothetical protein